MKQHRSTTYCLLVGMFILGLYRATIQVQATEASFPVSPSPTHNVLVHGRIGQQVSEDSETEKDPPITVIVADTSKIAQKPLPKTGTIFDQRLSLFGLIIFLVGIIGIVRNKKQKIGES